MTSLNNMTKTNQQMTVDDASNRQRLDVFLSEKLDITRSQAQKMIKNKFISLNGKVVNKGGFILKKEDIVNIRYSDIKILSRLKEGSRFRAGDIQNIKILKCSDIVVFESPDYVIINKPSGLLTHPTMANEEQSIAAILLKKYPKLNGIGEDPVRPGIVHRLDKEASGLLVVARTQKMFNELKRQFKERTVEKEYLVLVHGKVKKDWDEIKFPIVRSSSGERMAAIPSTSPEADKAKTAHTEFMVEQRFANMTLLRVKIHTGRTHQIRAHMFAYNHPIVGDPLYFQKKQKRKWDEKLGRLFLHCTKLVFKDLNGEIQAFESTLPTKLSSFLNLLSK